MTIDEVRIALILKLDELSDPAVERVLELALSLEQLETFYIKHGREKADKMIDEQLKKNA